MISRRSAKAIAEAYNETFSEALGEKYRLYADQLYDFLYLNDFDPWLLNSVRTLTTWYPRALKQFIMELHTGESMQMATATWDWAQRQTLGQRVLKDLGQCLIRERLTNPKFEPYSSRKKSTVDEMRQSLELDGFIYQEGILLIPEQTVIEEAEEQGVLENLAASVELQDPVTLKHHIDLSASDFQEGRWDDSISNSRKVLEWVLRQVAAKYDLAFGNSSLSSEGLAKQVAVRDYLEKVGLLEKKEKQTIAEVYGLLSNTGAHPYVAQRDQARLMRHLALTFSQFALLRLVGALRAGGANKP
jgi:hypothetical protein